MGRKLITAITSKQWWIDTAGNCAAAFLAAYFGAWAAAGMAFESIVSAAYAQGGAVLAFATFGFSLGVLPQVGDPTRARLS